MKYSIVVITYNRQKELFNCLESITRCVSPYPYEVIVIFNGDRAYLEKCAQTFKNFQMTFIHKTTPSAARNFAVKQTKGEYIFFLDDDCVLPESYFGNIQFDQGWDTLGGPDQTPLTSTPAQVIIGQTLSSPLCMGPTYKRHTKVKEYDTNANEKSLILCNLWMRASLFKNEGFEFNPDLFRNEENYLLKKLKSAGKVLHYNPEMFVYHLRKDELEKLGASVIKSGECRIQNFALLPQLKELVYLTPLVWFCFFVFALFHPMNLSMIIFVTYTLVVLIHYVMKYKSFSLRYIFYHFFILTAYSVGLLKGLIKFSPMLYSNLKENRSFMRESRSK